MRHPYSFPCPGYKKDKNGKSKCPDAVTCEYEVVVNIDNPRVIHLICDKCGIDAGIERYMTTSDGKIIENPRLLEKSLDKIQEIDKVIAGKQKGSNRKKKAYRKRARLYEKTRNQRKDFHHKTTRQLINEYDSITIEKLSIKKMIQEPALPKLPRSIGDAGWYTFFEILKHKAKEAGREVLQIDPNETTQVCSCCGKIVKKDLSVRKHNCCTCKLNIHRTLNSSKNILKRGEELKEFIEKNSKNVTSEVTIENS